MLVSAVTGEGIDALLEAIDARLGAADEILDVTFPPTRGAVNWLHENADVLERSEDDDGRITARVRVAAEKKPRLVNQLRQRRDRSSVK